MRQIATKAGKKWRCIKSIEAIRKTVDERDAFGKSVTAANSTALSVKMSGIRPDQNIGA